MKTLKKIQLNFNKEVISMLSNDDLSRIKGGATGTTDPPTANSEDASVCCTATCVCETDWQKTCPNHTKGLDCTIGGLTSSGGPICCPLPTESTPGGNCMLVTIFSYCGNCNDPTIVSETTDMVDTTFVKFTAVC